MSFRDFVPAHLLPLARLGRRFKASRRGNIAVMTALLIVPMMTLMGLALDYGNALLMKSRLDQAALAAASAAANAARNVLQSANRSDAGYDQKGMDGKALAEGKDIGVKIFAAQLGTIINGRNDAADVSVARVSNTFTANVKYSAQLNTYFMRVWNVNVLNLSGQRSIIVGMVDTANQTSLKGSIIDEQWKAPASSVQSSDPSKPVINDWFSGTPGSISPVVTDPTLLDSKVPTAIRVGSPDNSIAPIISKKIYLEKGDYQLRYWYRSTVAYPEYEPVFICGTVEDEMHWVTSSIIRDLGPSTNPSTTYGGVSAAQTSRAGAYLVPILSNPQLAAPAPAADSFSKPPLLPWTSSNLRRDNSANRVDICAYSSRWIERSIPIKVTNSGYFWLSFIAEPPESTYRRVNSTNTAFINGFYLGGVQLCAGSCSAPVNNNWPWTANTVLYKDTFDEYPTPTAGANFLTTRNIFPDVTPTTANYEKKPDWVIGRFGGGGSSIPTGFQYDNASGNMIVRSTVLGMWMYRRMLLMPGVYKFKFKASRSENAPDQVWCETGTGASALAPAANDEKVASTIGWTLKNPAIYPFTTCGCAAGYVTSLIASDEAIGNPQANRTVAGTAPDIYQSFLKNADGSFRVDRFGQKQNIDGAIKLSDCHSGNQDSRTNGDVYCVLVPRTQYYGLRLTVAGPTVTRATINGDPVLRGAYDEQLNSGGIYFDGLEVTLLSPGVQNRFTRTAEGPGDFDDYNPQCKTALAGLGNLPTATPDNIINGGIPMWPGYSTRTLSRVVVTAPSN